MAKTRNVDEWQPAPCCFACGRELGTEPGDVIYVGWGRREDGDTPRWVTTLCPSAKPDAGPQPAESCLETAQQWAAAHGHELTEAEYRRWLKTA